MSKVVNEVVAANQAYSQAFGAKGELPLPPARQFAIVTCMDARLDPAKYAGLAKGDAHIIRNAGGRAMAHDQESGVERSPGCEAHPRASATGSE